MAPQSCATANLFPLFPRGSARHRILSPQLKGTWQRHSGNSNEVILTPALGSTVTAPSWAWKITSILITIKLQSWNKVICGLHSQVCGSYLAWECFNKPPRNGHVNDRLPKIYTNSRLESEKAFCWPSQFSLYPTKALKKFSKIAPLIELWTGIKKAAQCSVSIRSQTRGKRSNSLGEEKHRWKIKNR